MKASKSDEWCVIERVVRPGAQGPGEIEPQ